MMLRKKKNPRIFCKSPKHFFCNFTFSFQLRFDQRLEITFSSRLFHHFWFKRFLLFKNIIAFNCCKAVCSNIKLWLKYDLTLDQFPPHQQFYKAIDNLFIFDRSIVRPFFVSKKNWKGGGIEKAFLCLQSNFKERQTSVHCPFTQV